MSESFKVLSTLILALFLAVQAQSASQCSELFHSISKTQRYQFEAQAAGLVYLSDLPKGISPERDPERFNALGVAPEYTDVWFSPLKNSHLQATAVSAAGKKQYYYHPQWNETVRNKIKFERLPLFGKALPHLRQQLGETIAQKQLNKERVMAALILLMDQTAIRIGDKENVKDHGTYGLTTLEGSHLKKVAGKYILDFVGKSSKQHEIEILDPRIIKVIQESLKLEGPRLFKYVGEDGSIRNLAAEEINEYLRQITKLEVSAKDFRTWVGTVAAAKFLYQSGTVGVKKMISKAADFAAKKLGNTRAMAKKSYIDPKIFTAYMQGTPFTKALELANGEVEVAVLIILAGEENEK